MALASIIEGEEYFRVLIGQGMYTSELASNIPDGFSSLCYNMVATGDSLENRSGIRRSSIDWKVLEHAPGGANPEVEKQNIICMLNTNIYNSDIPAFAWASWGSTVPEPGSPGPALNFVRSYGAAGTGDGFMSVSMPGRVTGIAQYNDRIYFTMAGMGVYYISAINWAADSITYTSVPSSATGTFHGLFTFKDRMWAHQGQWLYYTDIATIGGYPETWAFGVNRIPFVGPNGIGDIKKCVPLGNKLIVFTSAGMFTLLVEGAPQSWILRLLDSESISTTSQCAFESKGIVYYINTQGVWATNALYCTKLSAVIEDQFFLARGTRSHTINSYEDGMIISIAKLVTGSFYFDSHNCRTFYSKLDPIGWTDWNFGSWTDPQTDPSIIRTRKICQIYSTSKKVPTYINSDPTVYMLAFVGDSLVSDPKMAVLQLLIFDGGKDIFVNDQNVVETFPVRMQLKTKYIDGGNSYNLKQCKRGLIEIFSSDPEHLFLTSWYIDASLNAFTAKRHTQNQDFTVGLGSNLVQIPSLFHYRRCSLSLVADLQTDTSQIKIKDIAIVQNTERAEFEKVR